MIYLLYSYFKQNQCLNIKKHDVHNIYRLAWAFCAPQGPPPGEMPRCPIEMKHDNYISIKHNFKEIGLGLWCLTRLSAIFQLYRGQQF
jgi:hypothetical protein